MNKIVLLSVAFSLAVLSTLAQNILEPKPPYIRDDIHNRRVIPYAYLREADVMWSKRIWRVIDLSEKANLPLKYPLSKSIHDRKSLIDVIMDAVEEGTLTAYSPIGANGTTDDEFTLPMTQDELKKIGGAGTDTIQMTRPDPPYDTYDTVIHRNFSRDNVMGYRLKEDWFFDKQRSVLEPRIIGIAPLIYAVDEKGNKREGNYKVPISGFIILKHASSLQIPKCLIPTTMLSAVLLMTFFEKRFFISYIIKESNVYDRNIEAYATGLNALLESDRIKEEIANLEHDLWEN